MGVVMLSDTATYVLWCEAKTCLLVSLYYNTGEVVHTKPPHLPGRTKGLENNSEKSFLHLLLLVVVAHRWASCIKVVCIMVVCVTVCVCTWK